MAQSASKSPLDPGDVRIAGKKTVRDWQQFRGQLVPGGDPKVWRRAFHAYFNTRLSLRYLKPITVLQGNGTLQGEGFSIVAIQTTLVEFLESTIQGVSYRYRRRSDPPLGPYEYANSGMLFVAFLSTRQPFARGFNAHLARDFYENVRCGLLHEACTKGGWTIHAKSPAGSVVSAPDKIVYRDTFQAALLEFIGWYKMTLPSDIALQEAFIRKFDSLCQ